MGEECEVCGKRFADRGRLNRHVTGGHLKEKIASVMLARKDLGRMVVLTNTLRQFVEKRELAKVKLLKKFDDCN